LIRWAYKARTASKSFDIFSLFFLK
jgi:hypothetical protein